MVNLVDVIELSKQRCPQPIHGELAYASVYNLVGQIIDGYHEDADDICLLTPKAAEALCQVQNHLLQNNDYSLFIFDSYRPQRAVKHFLRWAEAPVANNFELSRKDIHFPNLEKSQLFAAHYLSDDSGHCYGNTVDLVLTKAKSAEFLPMGSIFDFMGEASHLSATAEQIGGEAYQHRLILIEAMKHFGFEPYDKEYWHFSHGGVAGREVKEPMDIEITRDLKGIGVKT